MMEIPSLAQAEAYLLEAASLNPGPWVAHSRYAAKGASQIAEKVPGLDFEKALILGLLHDIGRREGPSHMRHALDGFRFMEKEGYPDVGRICLTHSYPDKNLPAQAAWDGNSDDFLYFQDRLTAFEYDDYDRLIQLMDCLALPSGFCLMEKRFVDVTMRYGFNGGTVQRWKAYFALKKYFEIRIGVSVYSLLEGVVENTFYRDLEL
jgi:hypothetical protein